MLGEVVPPVEEVRQEESTHTNEEGTSEIKQIKVSEFNEQIRPGSSRSNSSHQTETSTDRTPETKRRGDKSARGEGKKLKKKKRTKSRDKLISKEKQKELLDEIEQEEKEKENKSGENVVCSVEKETTDTSGTYTDTTRSGDETLQTLNTTDDLNQTQLPDKRTESEGKLSPLHMSANSSPSGKETNHNLGVTSTRVSDSESDSDVPLDTYTKEATQLELPEGYTRERKLSYDGRREDTEIFLEMAKRVATPPPPPAPPYDPPPVRKNQSKKGTDVNTGDYHWDIDEHSSNIIVDQEKPNILLRPESKKSTDGARGSVGFERGRHEFEVRFNAAAWGSHCSIGVCTGSARMQRKGYNDLLGRDKHSWGWDIPSRELLHKGESCGTWGDHVSETPTLIGLILDMDAGTMSIVLDGDYKSAKPVFTGLEEVQKPLYPAVATVYPGMEISIKRHQESPPPVDPQVPEVAGVQEPVLQQENMSAWVRSEKIDEPDAEQEKGNERESGCESEDEDVSRGANKSVSGTDYEASHGDDEGNDKDDQDEQIDQNENGKQRNENETTDEVQQLREATVEQGNENQTSEEVQQLGETTVEQGNGNQRSEEGQTLQETHEQIEAESEIRKQELDNEEDEEQEEQEEDNEVDMPAQDQILETGDTTVADEVEQSEVSQSPVPDDKPQQVAISETTAAFSSYHRHTAAREEAERVQAELEQEIEQSPIIELSSLDPDDNYSLQMAYAWDATLKASKVQIYPGVPYICSVEPNFEDKFVGVRCRRTVKSGCHRWRIREVIMNMPNKAAAVQGTRGSLSNLILGIVNGEHRTFNYGFSLTQIGRHAWGWNHKNRRMMNGANNMTFPEIEQDGESSTNPTEDVLGLDLRLGLDIIMNCDTKKLTFEHQGQIFDASGCYRIFGKDFSPFVVFNGHCRAAVKIEYISGPEDEIQNALASVKKLKSIDWPDFAGFRAAATQLVTSSSIEQVEGKCSENYGWGSISHGVSQTATNEVSFTKGKRQVAISSLPLPTGRHTIDFLISNIDNLTIGFITSDAPMEELVNDPSVLGGGLNSWAWFVPGSWLVHAGSTIGKYPYMVKDYDQTALSCLRLVVTMKPNGGVVGFSVPLDTGKTLDLGIAFFNLPSDLRIVVTGVAGQDSSQNSAIKMVYKSGPSGFIEELRSLSSKVCTIL